MSDEVRIDNRQLYKVLAKIAVPISIQGVVSATLTLVDNLMCGFLGETELAAVGIATQIYFIHYLLLFGFTGGAATFMAQFYGAGELKNIRRTTGFAITVMLIVAAVFFIPGFIFTEEFLGIYTADPELIAMAVPYMRIATPVFFLTAVSIPLEMAFKSTHQTKVPMIVSVVVFTTNATLNYILIFGKFGAPALGVAGAAIGTTVARILELCINIFFAAGKSNVFYGNIKEYFNWNREMMTRILKNSAPTTLNEVFWSIGQSMYVAAFARLGTTAYAGYQAARSIYNIFAFAAYSMGDATLILVGKTIGEGKKEETWLLARKLLRIGLVVGGVIGVMQIAFSWPLVNLFGLTALGKKYAFYILIVDGILLSVNLYNGMSVTGVMRSGGDTKFAMISECSCVWFIAVPVAFITALVLHLPVHICVLAMKLEEFVKAAILKKRFYSRKWINVVIGGLEK